jgi:HEAT repeats
MTVAVDRVSPFEALRAEASETAEGLKNPEPPFEFALAWADSYPALFTGHGLHPMDESELLNHAMDTGRVALSARGGSGKTVLLGRIFRQALESGALPVYIDLKQWTPPDYDEWGRSGADSFRRMGFLLKRFASPSVSAVRLDSLPPNEKKVLLVDGLNEITSNVGLEVMLALDEFVGTLLQVSVVVADRLTRRAFPNAERWRLVTIRPLEQATIEDALKRIPNMREEYEASDETTRSILTVPFFLDETLRNKQLAASATEALKRFLVEHAELDEGELAQAAAAAMKMYVDSRGRMFRLDAFSIAAGASLAEKLRVSGILVQDESSELAHFSHHLQHDYLVSRYLAAHHTEWSKDTFDVVSFKAASFDTIAMTLEQIDTGAADDFVRSVYDWNVYGAAYAVIEARARGRSQVSRDMETVVYAMLAERRFDRVLATAQRASDALDLSTSEIAAKFKAAESPEELRATVARMPGDAPWFADWVELFTREDGVHDDVDVELLTEADSIRGWTYSNVLRRSRVDEEGLERLRNLLSDDSEVIRWRVVHVLGAFPSRENVEALVRIFSDPDRGWDRYGAVRSLVEIAARDESGEIRREVLSQLSARPSLLGNYKSIGDEFARAVLIAKNHTPEFWAESVLEVVDTLYQAASAPADRERWLRLASQIRESYAAEDN